MNNKEPVHIDELIQKFLRHVIGNKESGIQSISLRDNIIPQKLPVTPNQ